jgi:hypothetical protein
MMHPVRDASTPDAGGGELRGGHDAVLRGGELRDRRVSCVHFVALPGAARLNVTFGT